MNLYCFDNVIKFVIYDYCGKKLNRKVYALQSLLKYNCLSKLKPFNQLDMTK